MSRTEAKKGDGRRGENGKKSLILSKVKNWEKNIFQNTKNGNIKYT